MKVPIDIYIEVPDNFGGFVRYYEMSTIVEVASPVYLKFGLRNAPDIYPSGGHVEQTAVNLARERVRRRPASPWTCWPVTPPRRPCPRSGRRTLAFLRSDPTVAQNSLVAFAVWGRGRNVESGRRVSPYQKAATGRTPGAPVVQPAAGPGEILRLSSPVSLGASLFFAVPVSLCGPGGGG